MRDPFHDAFEAALAGDGRALAAFIDGDGAGRDGAGLAVYRNTVAKGRADVLAAAFPTVVRLTGEDWFRDAALAYAAENPPADPAMDRYGATFAAWLVNFEPARALPYLAPVARLDRAFSEAHAAPDAPVVEPAEAARLTPGELFAARAELHPSARIFWFDWTVASIWLSERGFEPAEELAFEERGEGLLIIRPRMAVTALRLDRPSHAFLTVCRRGQTLGQAVAAALRADPAAELRALFARLLEAGAFTRLLTRTPQ